MRTTSDGYPFDVLDLSLPLDSGTPIYADARGYADPPTRVESWVEIGERRAGPEGTFASPFRVSRLSIGLHTGTHLDSPAHFHAGRATVDHLPNSSLVGRAVVVDLAASADDAAATLLAARRAAATAPGSLALLLTPATGIGLATAAELSRWGPRLVVVAGPLDAADDPDCPRASALLAGGLWLATDVSVAAAQQVLDGDLLVVAPLPLRGVEGAPCRVLAIRTVPA